MFIGRLNTAQALLNSFVGGFNVLPMRKVERRKVPSGNFKAAFNRWTGKRHEHKREIARRIRQVRKLHAKYLLNGGFSRRGNEVGPIDATPAHG